MKTKVFFFALFIIGLLFIGTTVMAQERNPMEREPQHKTISAERAEAQGTENVTLLPPLIKHAEGEVMVGESKAETNLALIKESILRTVDGRAEIVFEDILVHLDKNTEIKILDYDKDFLKIFLTAGAIYTESAQKTVLVEAEGFSQTMKKDSLRIEIGKAGIKVFRPEEPSDDFGRFIFFRKQSKKPTVMKAEERTKAQEATTTTATKEEEPKKLPENYKEFLAQYGKWVEDEEYGMVWIPNSNEERDWAPYRKGKWQDYDNDCRYWFSYEPFGYVAYHYGRWQLNSLWGWYWIPGYVWGSAWVNWYWYGNYAYWSPMWYDYQYYNRYYDRYYSRSNSRAWTVVHKNQLKNPNLPRAIRTTQTSPVRIASNQIRSNIRPSQSPSTNNPRASSSPVKSISLSSAISRSSSRLQPTPKNSTLNRTPQNRFTNSPWHSDPRTKIQSNSRTSSSRPAFRPANQSRYASPRMSSPARSSSRPSAVRSTGATRSSAARTSAPRASSSRGGNVRRK